MEAEFKMSQNRRTNSQDLKIRQLINSFLRLRASSDVSSLKEQHLDEDSFAAFIEGNLGERETQPILTHLVNCSFCRNVTAELIRLDFAFAEPIAEAYEVSNTPSKVSEVLNNLLSRIFGSNDSVVFAHQESEEEIEKLNKLEDDKS
jgi:hypothetical protein